MSPEAGKVTRRDRMYLMDVNCIYEGNQGQAAQSRPIARRLLFREGSDETTVEIRLKQGDNPRAVAHQLRGIARLLEAAPPPVEEAEKPSLQLVLVNDVVEQWYLVRNGHSSMLDRFKAHTIRAGSRFVGSEGDKIPEEFRNLALDRHVMVWDVPDSLRE